MRYFLDQSKFAMWMVRWRVINGEGCGRKIFWKIFEFWKIENQMDYGGS